MCRWRLVTTVMTSFPCEALCSVHLPITAFVSGCWSSGWATLRAVLTHGAMDTLWYFFILCTSLTYWVWGRKVHCHIACILPFETFMMLLFTILTMANGFSWFTQSSIPFRLTNVLCWTNRFFVLDLCINLALYTLTLYCTSTLYCHSYSTPSKVGVHLQRRGGAFLGEHTLLTLQNVVITSWWIIVALLWK